LTHSTIYCSTHKVFSGCWVFTSRWLITAPYTQDSSASVFTSWPATDCLIAPHGCSSWPSTASRVWPPLATTRYHRLALASDSVLVCQSYFTTGSLQSITSYWHQAPWGSRPVSFFFSIASTVILVVKHPLWRSVRLSIAYESSSVLAFVYSLLRKHTYWPFPSKGRLFSLWVDMLQYIKSNYLWTISKC
jgi:hypothetical protein